MNEPTYVTSLVRQKPIEMIRPRKIAILILLRRGWTIGGDIRPPTRLKTYHAAHHARGNQIGYWLVPLQIPTFGQIVSDWQHLGVVKNVEGIECNLKRRHVLTSKGEFLLEQLAPEIMAEARAVARTIIWKIILNRRAGERHHLAVEKMQAEANRIAATKEKHHIVQSRGQNEAHD